LDQESFNYEILQCVTKGLDAFGPSVKQTVYWQLLVVYNLKPSDIVNFPETFVKALENMFGAGAVAIERAITLEFKSNFQVKSSLPVRFIPALKEIEKQLAILEQYTVRD